MHDLNCLGPVAFLISATTSEDLDYRNGVRFLALIPDEWGKGMAIDDGCDEYEIPDAIWRTWRHHKTVEAIVNSAGRADTPAYLAIVLDTVQLTAFIMQEHDANLFCAQQHPISASNVIMLESL